MDLLSGSSIMDFLSDKTAKPSIVEATNEWPIRSLPSRSAAFLMVPGHSPVIMPPGCVNVDHP